MIHLYISLKIYSDSNRGFPILPLYRDHSKREGHFANLDKQAKFRGNPLVGIIFISQFQSLDGFPYHLPFPVTQSLV